MNRYAAALLEKARDLLPASRTAGEHCVLCGHPTGIHAESPVDRRDYYVEGAGQLCRECWQKLYGSS